MNTHRFASLITCLPLLGCLACQAPSSHLDLLRDSAKLRETETGAEVSGTIIPNLVLGYVDRNGNTEFLSYGSLSLEDPRPVDEDTLFGIASMTKAITATAALQLVEQGKIGLDQPIEAILPEIRQIGILQEDGSTLEPKIPLTLRHLLCHTSGFAYFFTSPVVAKEVQTDPATGFPLPDEIAEGEYDWGFDLQPRRVFEAGEAWIYGRSLGIAGRLIERISGEDLDTYFKRHIFEPLGMDRSGYNVSKELMKERASLHMREPVSGELTLAPDMRPFPMERFYGGGDLLSTPKDYATFLRCMLNEGELDGVRILDSELTSLFFSDQLPAEVTVKLPSFGQIGLPRRSITEEFDDGHSLAWVIEVGAEDGLRPEGVGYWSGIFNTYYTVDPKNGIAIFAFSQMLPFDDADVYEMYRSYEDKIYRALR